MIEALGLSGAALFLKLAILVGGLCVVFFLFDQIDEAPRRRVSD